MILLLPPVRVLIIAAGHFLDLGRRRLRRFLICRCFFRCLLLGLLFLLLVFVFVAVVA